MISVPRLRGFCAGLLATMMLAAPVPSMVLAQGQPLLVEERQTVYQRVLTRPGTTRHAAPGADRVGDYPAFQPLYVFAREPDWIQVGPSISRPPEAWVPASDVVDWRQNIVGAFTNPAGRQRSILFETADQLRWLLNHEALLQIQNQMLAEADTDLLSPERQIVAVEPAEYVDITERLYLMPILDFIEDFHPTTYEPNLLMEVAVVPLQGEGNSALIPSEGAFDTGIVFVFDTTQSMDPFIASTQEAVEQIVRRIQGTSIGERTNFGVVAFRDNPDAAPGLEYRTRMLLPLERRPDQTPVVATIRAATQVAQANSPGFNEDSLAGVEDAIDLIDWDAGGADPYDGRFIILVTDAGPKAPDDPNARSRIGVEELAAEAERAGITLMTLHLQTPAGGEAQHEYARDQYQRLTRRGNNSFYYPIPEGSSQQLQSEVTRLVTAIADVVRRAEGQEAELSAEETGAELLELGLALQLAYLGDQQGTQAPSVFSGWVSEKAVEDPRRLAVSPRLLVTRNELATMYDLMGEVLDLWTQGDTEEDSQLFFSQVRDVVSRMAQNPDRLLNTEATTLGGALEFLKDLPYESQIMSMTPQRWSESAMTRSTIIGGIRQKLVLYGRWLRDPSVWTPLYDGAPDGEHVFAMPFDTLP
ncbi:MAG: vWA domain-containing protein [Roseovarius sp.]